MASRLSRHKIAIYAVDRLMSGGKQSDALRHVAAYLVETRRTRELDLLVRDIEAEFADRGIVVAEVTSAHALTEGLKEQVAKLVGAKDLQVREVVDPNVIGGVRVDTPGKRFDATIAHALASLRAKQI